MSNLLQIGTSASARRAITWDDTDDTVNIEALVKLRAMNISNGSVAGPGIALRVAGAASSETAYLAYITTGSNRLRLHRYVSGSGTSVGSAYTSGDAVQSAVWYWIRFQVVGNALKAKFWADGDTEPGNWHIEATDGSIPGAGSAGVWPGFSSDTTQVAWFSYAVGSSPTAPGPS